MIQAFFIHVLSAGTAHSWIDRPVQEMQAVFLDNAPNVSLPEIPEFVDNEIPLIPPPEVVVLLERGPNAITAQVTQPILGPRMDPLHVNLPPELPPALRRTAAADPVVVLRVLVLEDGRLGEVELAETCGLPAIDDMAISFAKANWRYLPAMRNGRPIEDWLTVAMRLRNT